MKRIIWLSAVGLCFAFAAPAHAQLGWQAPVSGVWFGNNYFNAERNKQFFADAMATTQARTRQDVRQVTLRPTYVSSPARTRVNLSKFVEEIRATDPAGATKMAELFASTDIIGMIDQRMQSTYGMRANNVADAYAVWWVSAWMGAQGRSDDATQGQMAMVKRQASNALAATPEFASATDAGKQELAEALLVQAALIGDTIDTYKSDPAMLAKTRASIKQGAKAMGLDLTTMTLTDEGFRPARTTGAVATPDETQLAGARPATEPGNDNPPYLLLAAAGGAGIGGIFFIGKLLGRLG